MIQIENLTFCYPNGFTVLDRVNFTVGKGEFVALIGQNGAGKTTLLKHLNALLKPTSGKVTVCQMDTRFSTTGKLAQKVGFLFQNPDHQIFNSTVEREIAFGLKNLKMDKQQIRQRTLEAAAAVGLEETLAENPIFLSKGQRQRVAFASLLAMRPEIMVLDEPTTGQDYQEGIQIMEMVKDLNRQGHTILFVTHDMELVARYAQRVIVLNQGKVLMDGTPRQVFYQPEILRQTNLFPPQIARLVQRFDNYQDWFGPALTVEECFQAVIALKEGEANVGCC